MRAISEPLRLDREVRRRSTRNGGATKVDRTTTRTGRRRETTTGLARRTFRSDPVKPFTDSDASESPFELGTRDLPLSLLTRGCFDRFGCEWMGSPAVRRDNFWPTKGRQTTNNPSFATKIEHEYWISEKMTLAILPNAWGARAEGPRRWYVGRGWFSIHLITI